MSDVILYTTDDGRTQIDLQLENGTVWLSQLQIAELFQTTKQNVSKHIKAIYEDQELDEQATVNQQLTVQKEGEEGKTQTGRRDMSEQVFFKPLSTSDSRAVKRTQGAAA